MYLKPKYLMSNKIDFGCLFDSPTKRYNPRHTTTEAACAVKGSGGETQYAILLTGIVARKTRIFCAGIPSRSGCTAWYICLVAPVAPAWSQ